MAIGGWLSSAVGMIGDEELTEPDWLDYFSGGVPTGEFFRLTLDELKDICGSSNKTPGINRLHEVCFIGLVSYFEAFCKDLFASIINILPDLLENLRKNGQDTSIDASRVLTYPQDLCYKIGFILAEKYDFGSAQKINAVYRALLNITPFSVSEIVAYNAILRDRNLFVHHGGMYTLSYLQQAKIINDYGKDRAFFDSLVITKDQLIEKLEFIDGVAHKLSRATHNAMAKYVSDNQINLGEQRQKAMDAIPLRGGK
jgi:hypothetical protein